MTARLKPPVPVGRAHLVELVDALGDLVDSSERIESWGRRLAGVLGGGGRLLAAGNGGSAAQAQHLTAELVGRFHGDRRPLSAIALCAETSSVTAIVNDYGADELFARQVEAHGRPGDVLVLLSTSGTSPNLVCAARRARACGVTTWGLTGATPNALSSACDETFAIASPHPTVVQELHLVVVHLLCAAVDAAIDRPERTIDLDAHLERGALR